MKNAHERFGILEYTKRMKDTTTQVRLRLDRLIEKIKILDNQRIEDTYERLLRAQFADGKLDASIFKQLLSAYQQQTKGPK